MYLKDIGFQFAIIESSVWSWIMDLSSSPVTDGKSIIFDAIELLLGGRANHDMIQLEQSLRVLKVFFRGCLPARSDEAVLEEYGCPIDDELHIRRVLARKVLKSVYQWLDVFATRTRNRSRFC